MGYEESSSPLERDDRNHLLDRSKVKILLCDNDAKSSQEVFRLLCKCSYQVTSVRTARQVINTLNAEGPDIDIILAEVDLPVSKGLKMLRYLMRDKELRRIPIIMMSSQDEVSVVVKCLRLGAADYLVKPLRTNELLNLWTHMWRRRRMLGLAEKNILKCDFDLAASDPSDTNTNSTTLFSEDTDDKSQRSKFPETSAVNNPEFDSKACDPVETSLRISSEYHRYIQEPHDRPGGISSCPRKSELKVGESSAFFTYVKSSAPTINYTPRHEDFVEENVAPSELLNQEKFSIMCQEVVNDEPYDRRDAWGYNSSSSEPILNNFDVGVAGEYNFPSGNGFSSGENVAEVETAERSHHVSMPSEYPQEWSLFNEPLHPTGLLHPSNERQMDITGVPSLARMPFYLPQFMMPPSGQLYQGSLHDAPKHDASVVPHCGAAVPQCTHLPMNMMGSFHYYHPLNTSVQQGHLPASSHIWPSAVASSSLTDLKSGRVERREAALIKFRQKRKDRCFDKKVRYVNRKRLAERRPRVRGQFVRQVNGVDVDINGRAVVLDDDSDEDKEDDEDEDDDTSEF